MKKSWSFPPVMVLVNHLGSNRYDMVIDRPLEIQRITGVDTMDRDDCRLTKELLTYTVTCEPAEALFFAALWFRLTKKQSPAWADGFGKAKIICTMDGSKVLEGRAVAEHLIADPETLSAGCVVPYIQDICLFEGIPPCSPVESVYTKAGLFLPSGTVVRVGVSGIPGGESTVPIEAGFVGAFYRKKRP